MNYRNAGNIYMLYFFDRVFQGEVIQIVDDLDRKAVTLRGGKCIADISGIIVQNICATAIYAVLVNNTHLAPRFELPHKTGIHIERIKIYIVAGCVR